MVILENVQHKSMYYWIPSVKKVIQWRLRSSCCIHCAATVTRLFQDLLQLQPTTHIIAINLSISFIYSLYYYITIYCYLLRFFNRESTIVILSDQSHRLDWQTPHAANMRVCNNCKIDTASDLCDICQRLTQPGKGSGKTCPNCHTQGIGGNQRKCVCGHIFVL